MKVYAVHHELAHDPKNNNVWTISENPNEEGWETDTGYSGYGLPKEKAEHYVKCINEYERLLSLNEQYGYALSEIMAWTKSDRKDVDVLNEIFKITDRAFARRP